MKIIPPINKIGNTLAYYIDTHNCAHFGKDIVYTNVDLVNFRNTKTSVILKTKALNYITTKVNNNGICIYNYIIGQPIYYLYIYPKE